MAIEMASRRNVESAELKTHGEHKVVSPGEPEEPDSPRAKSLSDRDASLKTYKGFLEREKKAEIFSYLFSGYEIWTTDNGMVIAGALVPHEKLTLELEGQMLFLRADHKSYGTIAGSYLIPTHLDAEKIGASQFFDALTIAIPRRKVADFPDNSALRPRARKIDIVRGRFSTSELNVNYILRRLADPPVSTHISHPEQPSHGAKMLEDDRIITKEGTRYFPISLAAEFAQVPRTTLLDWINAKVKFEGRSLKTYDSPTARKMFLAEESVDRLARRFVKWPSKEPAGEVVIGETDDQTGYVGIAKAARAVGLDHHTLWLWITKETAPTEGPLDVIKCSASDQLYIHEKDISEIKRLIPKSGLRRGRRPRQAAQPS